VIAAFLAGVLVGLLVAAVVRARRRDHIVGLCVSLGRWERRTILMWVPVDQMDVGDTCELAVVARKKSGKLVDLSPTEYTAADGTFVEIVGTVVTGKEEGLATITATLTANPAVVGSATIAIADPVVELLVKLGRTVADPEPPPE
jgi:hypothetical protein